MTDFSEQIKNYECETIPEENNSGHGACIEVDILTLDDKIPYNLGGCVLFIPNSLKYGLFFLREITNPSNWVDETIDEKLVEMIQEIVDEIKNPVKELKENPEEIPETSPDKEIKHETDMCREMSNHAEFLNEFENFFKTCKDSFTSDFNDLVRDVFSGEKTINNIVVSSMCSDEDSSSLSSVDSEECQIDVPEKE